MLTATAILSVAACSEDTLEAYDTSTSALNIARGTVFGSAADYPESYSFNAYFLGGKVTDYTLQIPVRLQGVIDYGRDRHFGVMISEAESKGVTASSAVVSFDSKQVFRSGMYQDTLRATIHVDKMDSETTYKMRLKLIPGDDFSAGVPEYQYVDVQFTKNLTIAPAFWENNSKLSKITYSARKCAVFLEISGITDPEWVDDCSSVILDYWISLCKQWFEQHEEYDSNGNRIYFE